MRTLSSAEANSVVGAGYTEDVVAAAATLYVGSRIGNVAAAISTAAFTFATSLAGNGVLGTCLAATGSVVTPVAFFAAPLIVYEKLYPGDLAQKAESFFSK